jgi:hypothetical protein
MPDHTEYETGARKLQAMPEDNNKSPEHDAAGQSEKHHQGGSNDGVSSANPRVISGNEDGDATFPFKREADGNAEIDNSPADEDDRPGENFPPFDDPAFSSKPATAAIAETAVEPKNMPKDPIFAGHPDFSQEAGKNKLPPGLGNSKPLDDVNEKTRHSDGQNPPNRSTPSPDIQKVAGSGPSIAEHSKDAKAPSSGRQPGAYVKE